MSVTSNLALLYRYIGRDAEAEPLYLQTVETQRRLLGPEHPDPFASINNLGLVYQSLGRYEVTLLLGEVPASPTLLAGVLIVGTLVLHTLLSLRHARLSVAPSA